MEYPTDFAPTPVLTQAELTALESIGSLTWFSPNSLIMEENEVTDYVLLLLTGHIKVVKTDHNRTMTVRGPGEIVGEIATFLDRPRSASVYSIGRVSARHIPARDWLQFLREHPRAMFAQLRTLAQRLTETTAKTAETLLGSEQKLAKALMELLVSGVGEAEAGSVALRFNQRELADLAGISRESVVLVVRGFKKAGIVSTGRHLTRVLDQELLKAIADGTATVAGS